MNVRPVHFFFYWKHCQYIQKHAFYQNAKTISRRKNELTFDYKTKCAQK